MLLCSSCAVLSKAQGGTARGRLGANHASIATDPADPTWHPAATKTGSAGGATAEAQDVICQKAGCDQAEALNFIKRWLPGSGDRCGRRKRRFREAFVVEQPDDPHSRSADYRLLAAAGFLPSHSSQGPDSTTVTVPPTQPDLQ
ncbi:uncharacterized protein LOC142769124 isoform X3 [Rhipicephalus microplus]|uniref:uncharacterized protein LOC142769124 isoform X3 n=1 Tax=Rhipicephalus microplus TaxID=6941 RepID=UPI003F6C3F4D